MPVNITIKLENQGNNNSTPPDTQTATTPCFGMRISTYGTARPNPKAMPRKFNNKQTLPASGCLAAFANVGATIKVAVCTIPPVKLIRPTNHRKANEEWI